jgi:hypothetical protein
MTPVTLTYEIARAHERERAARVTRVRPASPAWWRRRGE